MYDEAANDDIEDFFKTDDALSLLVDETEKVFVYTIIAAILHLGNVTFGEENGAAAVTSEQPLEYSALLLGIAIEDMRTTLMTKEVIANGEAVLTNLDVVEALSARDAIAKEMYSSVFTWLVERINRGLFVEDYESYIALLDIFGFEDFGNKNCFEQFCINYANETLQFFYNRRIFAEEHRMYERENLKVDLAGFSFDIRSPCLVLIEEVVLPLLDSYPVGESGAQIPPAINTKTRGNHSHFRISPTESSFVIKHFAGEVNYGSGKFIEKNHDRLHPGFLRLIAKSSYEFIQNLSKIAINSRQEANMGNAQTLGSGLKNHLRCWCASWEILTHISSVV